MKKLVFSLSILGWVSFAQAQESNPYSLTQPWQDKPVVHTVNSAFEKSDAVYLVDSRKVEYKFEGKEFYMYTHLYKLIKVINDKGIEMFNKMYIPVYANGEIQNIKVRAVLPGGKVIDLPADKIKEVVEDGRKYKLFALEGLEKGAEVEYMYTVKKGPSFFGSETFQGTTVPTEKASFTLVSPSHLVFQAKGYNNFQVSEDTVIGERRFVTGAGSLIKELSDSKYALIDPYQQRIDYKLSYNLGNSSSIEMYSWKDLAKRLYDNFISMTDKEEKAIGKLINTINFEKLPNDEAKIKAIEDYIKLNFNIDKDLVSENATDIKAIIETKNASDDGIVRVFVNLFEKAGIRYNLVFPSDRDEYPIDEEFANWNRVRSYLIYFPQTGQYISPTDIALRYPFIPPYQAATRGLFLKTTTIGNIKTAVSSFGDIPMIPFSEHNQNMECDVVFDATGDSLIINSKQILQGYGAYSYRPIYTFLPKEKQDELTKSFIKNVAKSENITNIKVDNAALTDYYDNKPLIFSGRIVSSELLENAGNKILLKIGEIIGQQEQMYQEKPRVLPVDLSYPHVLDRKITLTIPEGYVVKNLAELNIDVSYKKDGEVSMGFVSTYQQEGSKVTIHLVETYREIHYPLSQFEDFKKVINAAADFNKVTLVLEKK